MVGGVEGGTGGGRDKECFARCGRLAKLLAYQTHNQTYDVLEEIAHGIFATYILDIGTTPC